MPFGPYRDHDDCVARNANKRDPDAYCAEIRRRAGERTDAAATRDTTRRLTRRRTRR